MPAVLTTLLVLLTPPQDLAARYQGGAVTRTELALEFARRLRTRPVGQEALQHMLFAVIASQIARKAATDEAAELRVRVAALEAERASTNLVVADAAAEREALLERVAELESVAAVPVDEEPVPFVLTEAAAALPARAAHAEDVTPQVRKLRALLAGQRAAVAVEDPHDGPLHHSYRVGRDLPATGGEQR